MPIANLSFVTTHTYNYPPFGPQSPISQSSMTVCKVDGDPMLAFMTQTQFEDEVVYLQLGCDQELFRHDTPAGHNQISGMAYDPIREIIWCGQGYSNADEIIAFDPSTGQVVDTVDISGSNTIDPSAGSGLGTNGMLMTRSGYNSIELRLMNGTLLGVKQFPTQMGLSVTGMTASPFSWTCLHAADHKISVLNLFGEVIAECPGVGAIPGAGYANGMQAIAFDYVSDMNFHPQVFENCGIGAVGTIHHPDTPWSPEPWLMRHRIYIANNSDQTIYAGYFTAN